MDSRRSNLDPDPESQAFLKDAKCDLPAATSSAPEREILTTSASIGTDYTDAIAQKSLLSSDDEVEVGHNPNEDPPEPGPDKEDSSQEDTSKSKSKEQTPTPKLGWKNKRYSGLLLTLCSGFMFASLGLIVKYLKGFHVLNLGMFRFTGMFVSAVPLVIYAQHGKKQRNKAIQNETDDEKAEDGHHRNQSIFEPIWPLTDPQKLKMMGVLFARAFVGFAAVTSHFLSIQHMPVADAMVIGSCSSVFVTFVAHAFLGEKCGIFPVLSALLTVIGVGVIARPPIITGEESYNMDTLIGTCFALGRMILTSVAIIFVRYLRGVNAALIVVSIGFLQLIQSTSAALIFGVFSIPTDAVSILLCCAVGLLSFGSQISLTLALKCEQAGPFAIVRTSSDTIFAFILQFLFLGAVPDMFSLIGAGVVILAVFLTVIRKWVASLPKDDPSRIKYWFVLK